MNMNEEQQSDSVTTADRHLLNAELLVWLRLMRVHTRINGIITTFLRRWDLPLAQFDALTQVYAAEGICQQDLAQRLLETKGNISRLLDRLERRGWLERRNDGRSNKLYLTAAGRALAMEVIPAQNLLVTEIMRLLPAAERHDLHGTLRHLDRILHRMADGADAPQAISSSDDDTHLSTVLADDPREGDDECAH